MPMYHLIIRLRTKLGANKLKIISTIKIKLIVFSFFHIVHENKDAWLRRQAFIGK